MESQSTLSYCTKFGIFTDPQNTRPGKPQCSMWASGQHFDPIAIHRVYILYGVPQYSNFALYGSYCLWLTCDYDNHTS